MKTALLVFQLLVSIFLILVILLQAKGSGLSGVFGGESGFYRSKRGVEKMLMYLTVVLAFLFFVLSLVQTLISK